MPSSRSRLRPIAVLQSRYSSVCLQPLSIQPVLPCRWRRGKSSGRCPRQEAGRLLDQPAMRRGSYRGGSWLPGHGLRESQVIFGRRGARRWPRGSYPGLSRVPASDVRGAPGAGGLHPGSGCRRHPRVLPQEVLLAALHPPSKSPCLNCPTKSRQAQHPRARR